MGEANPVRVLITRPEPMLRYSQYFGPCNYKFFREGNTQAQVIEVGLLKCEHLSIYGIEPETHTRNFVLLILAFPYKPEYIGMIFTL
jgi:hypothetical protein